MASESRQTDERTANDGQTNQMENIKVAVRLRPFTEKERQRNNRRIVDIEQKTVVLYNPRDDVGMKKFTFDYSYWSHDGYKRDSNAINVPDPTHPNCGKYVGQEEVFQDLGQFLLVNALKGYNSALLAYGQTGSGKSYTVSGYGCNEGILPRFARALFEELNKKSSAMFGQSVAADSNNTNVDDQAASKAPENDQLRSDQVNTDNTNRYEVFFSMIEIYNEVVRDLLAKNHGDLVTHSTFARRGLKVREHPKHGFFVENLTSYACADKLEIERRIEEGQLNKSIAATSMNETSSRGHTIYEFKIKQYKLKSTDSNEETLTTSVVQLVDLAGSERLAVHVTGQMGGDSFIGGRTNTPFPSNDAPRSARNVNRASVLNSASSSSSNNPPPSTSSRQRATHNNQSSFGDHQKRFKESVSINQSLSALGNCIQVLSKYSQQIESNGSTKKPPKIPYRDSVLTKLLNRCCLSGNSKVVIIATLSPADTNYDDTLSTLRFADRAKQIKTHAIINRMSRNEVVDTLQKENDRLKQMVDGRITRSDDSSQTSNFDDSENVMENFTGSRINSKATANETTATPVRSRTTIRKSRDTERHKIARKVDKREANKLTSSSSNPSLQVREQMKRLVSPASRKMTLENRRGGETIHKSRSMIHGLSGNDEFAEAGDDDLEEVELNDLHNFEAANEDDLGDIVEGLISPESEDSTNELNTDELSNEEKIAMFNKLLSVSKVNNSSNSTSKSPEKEQSQRQRPRKANRLRGNLRQISMMSSSLKKSNPYLSNLNPDEQLTGVISYIIKEGVNIVGKSSDCDIVLHGTELRGHHAKITRVDADPSKNDAEDTDKSGVHIEPMFEDSATSNQGVKNVALMVNGSPVVNRTPLNHCDRVLFGTNAYFVFSNNLTQSQSGNDTVADLDLVTYDMARNEVLKKVMAEEKNEAMIKEINDYTHRPGTGKHNVKLEEQKERIVKRHSARISSKTQSTKLMRSMTINDSDTTSQNMNDQPETENLIPTMNTSSEDKSDEAEDKASLVHQEASYREQLMQDTYELAIPIAEVNAVAKEMGIKVSYGLKILTGEEQLAESISPTGNLSTSEGSSMVDDGKASVTQPSNSEEVYTHLYKLDGLDMPPAVYIKVHLEEQDLEFYWSKEKFQARRYKILELYGAWDLGGKAGLVEYLIDQSKAQGDYLIDPFVDDAHSTPILIGHAQITLQPISHLTDVNQSYDIMDLNDEILGNIDIHAIPCEENEPSNHSSDLYRPFTDEELKQNLIEDPNELVGKKLIFMLKIISCTDIPHKYASVYCQYSLSSDRLPIRTKVLREESSESVGLELESEDLVFDHMHFICFERVSRDIIDFLQHGFVTIQVVGHHKVSNGTNRSPTVISTIITSINKYKYKIENQNLYGPINYTSAYSNSNPDSARSNQGPPSGTMNSNSGPSSVASTSATVNLFDQQNDDDEGINSINGLSQENIIDMILTKRKLDRAENQLHYLKRTVNIAEHYNKKHIPVKTVKKLLNSYGHALDSGSIEEMAADGKRHDIDFALSRTNHSKTIDEK